MGSDTLRVCFWGVRGSTAAGGAAFVGVGGHTSCVEVRAAGELIVLDAGSGLVRLGESLPRPIRGSFLFSHVHWDHIQGFPFFRPAYEAGNRFDLYGPGRGRLGVEAALRRQMRPPHFPVPFDDLRARMQFHPLSTGDEFRIGPAVVRAQALNHPQGALGYRITVDGTSVVYATDTEPLPSRRIDPALVALAAGADLLICDAQYTDDEYDGRTGPDRRGWGHSTITDACRVACAARVRTLALFHHDPGHDDRTIDALESEARKLFPRTVAARQGMIWTAGASEEAASPSRLSKTFTRGASVLDARMP